MVSSVKSENSVGNGHVPWLWKYVVTYIWFTQQVLWKPWSSCSDWPYWQLLWALMTGESPSRPFLALLKINILWNLVLQSYSKWVYLGNKHWCCCLACSSADHKVTWPYSCFTWTYLCYASLSPHSLLEMNFHIHSLFPWCLTFLLTAVVVQ